MNKQDNAAFNKLPSEVFLEELEPYDFRDRLDHPLRNNIIFLQLLACADKVKNPADI